MAMAIVISTMVICNPCAGFQHLLTMYFLVSLVDGFNLPMRIDNSVGCPIADCPVDLGPNCTRLVDNLLRLDF